MIDIEDEVYERIVNQLSASFSSIYAYKYAVPEKAKYPCVTIEQVDNSVVESTQDSGSNENHVNVAFDVNAYSNKANGRKDECKAIAQVIDDEMGKMGFLRISLVPFSQSNATRFRLSARYTGVISKNKTVYRR